MKSVVFGAIGLGCLLLLGSGVWTTLFPAKSSWTAEKEARWSDVQRKLYDMSFVVHGKQRIHSGPDPGTLKAEYEELKKQNEILKEEFENITKRPQTVATFLKWSGVSLAVLGIIGWYAVKD
jgi:hypothetical protein